MALRLTKTTKVVFALTIVLLSGALGYLIWRVNQKETVAPQESQAGGGAGACCVPVSEGGPGCVAGFTCQPISCNADEGGIPASDCTGEDSDPDYCCGAGYRCRILPYDGVTVTCVNPTTHTCHVVSGYTCVADEPDEPPVEGDCQDTICEWPQVVMSGTNDPESEPVCRCESCTGVDPADPWSCSGNPPSCTPGGCPSGYTDCGDSTNHESGGGCAKSSVSCVAHHPDCNNPTYVFRYCKPATETNVCDSGAWVTRPTGTYTVGTDIPYSLTAQDSNGIDKASITSKLCTGSVALCTSGQSITPTVTGTTSPITISGTLTNLAVGTYTITFSWADSLGAVGSDCTLTTTFTLVEEESPGLNIVKSAVESCIDEGTDNPKSELIYTITVTNTGSGIGNVSQIEDVLDSKILSASIVPTDITSPGQYSNGKILWSFSPALSIPAGSSQVYSYKLLIEKANFGDYNNTVTLTPVTGDTIQATAEITADCLIEIPATGLFDTTLGRIATGILLLILGVLVYNVPNSMFVVDREKKREMYMAGFEKKVANR